MNGSFHNYDDDEHAHNETAVVALAHVPSNVMSTCLPQIATDYNDELCPQGESGRKLGANGTYPGGTPGIVVAVIVNTLQCTELVACMSMGSDEVPSAP